MNVISSFGPHSVAASLPCHLRMETDKVSEALCSFRVPDNEQRAETQ
jgi:hypothetical protein